MICMCEEMISFGKWKPVREALRQSVRRVSNSSSKYLISNVGDNAKVSVQGSQYSKGGQQSLSGGRNTNTSGRNDRGMKAWEIHSYGGLEELQFTENCRIPVIKLPTDVLIKVHAASVNPIDIAMTKGYGSNTINILRNVDCGVGGLQNLLKVPSSSKKDIIEFPLTMGRDFSGVVVETGHGVTDLNIGDEVYGAIGVQRNGSHAEYTLASQDTVKRKPKNLNFVEASSLPYVGLTSWAAIKVTGNFLNLSAKRFLVLGSSGGVGTFAVQYLKSQGSHVRLLLVPNLKGDKPAIWGNHGDYQNAGSACSTLAQVVATCSQDAISLLEKLGSDFVVDYRQTDYLFQIQSFAPYDCILDLSGPDKSNNASGIKKFLKPVTGQYITLSPPFLSNIDKYGLIGGAVKNLNDIVVANVQSFSSDRVPTKWAFFIPSGHALESFTELVERQRIKPVIGETFSFSNLPEAYRRVEAGHLRGKVVIEMQ